MALLPVGRRGRSSDSLSPRGGACRWRLVGSARRARRGATRNGALMSTTFIRWGILGAGGIARTFARELPFTRTGRLQAVAARTPERAEKLAREFDVPSSYGSYEELLADDRIDAVYIATVHTNQDRKSVV